MLKITIFNITSLTSGALGKEIAPKEKLYPKSYMRWLGKMFHMEMLVKHLIYI